MTTTTAGTDMNPSKYAVLIWALLLATAAVAGDEQRTKIAIQVESDAAGEQTFHFDSEDAGFDLHSLAIGESRVWTDDSGQVANIMRTTDGFEIDVAGETIAIGNLGGDEMADTDAEVEEVRKIKMIKKGGEDDITIISSDPIDEATRQRIRDALQASGKSSEVVFIDSSHAKGKHEVRVIRKEVDVTN